MRANTFRFVVRGTTSVYFRLTPETSTGTNIPLRCNVRTRTFLLGTRSKRQLRNVFRRFFAPAYTTRRLSVPMKTRTSFFHSHCAYYSRRFSVCQAPFLIFSTAAKSCAFFSSLVTQRRSILVVRFSGRSSAFKTPWRSVALFMPPVSPSDMRSAGVRG